MEIAEQHREIAQRLCALVNIDWRRVRWAPIRIQEDGPVTVECELDAAREED